MFKSLLRRQQWNPRVLENRETVLQCFTGSDTDVHSFTSPVQGHSNLPFALAFSSLPQQSHLLGVADEDGLVTVLNTDQRYSSYRTNTSAHSHGNNNKEVRHSFPVHANAIFDLCWCFNDTCLATASADQSVRITDLNTQQMVSEFKGHQGSVKTINHQSLDGSIFVSGGRDGYAMIWDSRQTQPAAQIGASATITSSSTHDLQCICPDPRPKKRGRKADQCIPHPPQSVTAAVFLMYASHLLATASSANGTVKVWDIRQIPSSKSAQASSVLPVHTLEPPHTYHKQYGISSLSLHPNGQHILAAATNHHLYCYHLRKPEETRTYGGHQSNFYTRAAFSPDGDYIATGSTDHYVHLYQHSSQHYHHEQQQKQLPGLSLALGHSALEGHTAESTCVAWSCSALNMLASCSDDNTVRIWRRGRQAERKEEAEAVYVKHRNPSSQLEPQLMETAEDDEEGKENDAINNDNVSQYEHEHSQPVSEHQITPLRILTDITNESIPSSSSSSSPSSSMLSGRKRQRRGNRSAVRSIKSFLSPMQRVPISSSQLSQSSSLSRPPSSSSSSSTSSATPVTVGKRDARTPTLIDIWSPSKHALV